MKPVSMLCAELICLLASAASLRVLTSQSQSITVDTSVITDQPHRLLCFFVVSGHLEYLSGSTVNNLTVGRTMKSFPSRSSLSLHVLNGLCEVALLDGFSVNVLSQRAHGSLTTHVGNFRAC